MKKIIRLIKTYLDTIFFQIRYPYNFLNCSVLNLKNISINGYVRFNKGSRLASNSGGHVFLSNVWFGNRVEINLSDCSLLQIKDGTTVQDDTKILGDVIIERNVIFAPRVFVSSGNHQAFAAPYLDIKQQDLETPVVSKKVQIEEDVWLGVNAFIKSGVTVGRGAVIGANSVVTSNISPYEVVAGAPARLIKKRLEFIPPKSIQRDDRLQWPYFYRGFERPNMRFLDDLCIIRVCNPAAKKMIFSIENSDSRIVSIANSGFDYTIKSERGQSSYHIILSHEVKEDTFILKNFKNYKLVFFSLE